MEIKHILLRTYATDNFFPPVIEKSKVLTVDLAQQEAKASLLQHKVFELVNQSALSNEILDLLHLSLMGYTVDQTVSREANGYLGWSRHLRCYIPVIALDKWESIRSNLEEMFSYLSGDRWEFVFRQDISGRDAKGNSGPASSVSAVCLFSGGLDSFIGALDLLQNGEDLALVSHYKKGGVEHKAQDTLANLLRNEYPKRSINNYRFYVQPNQSFVGAEKETSSRARSLLFIGLGLAVANSLGNTPLIIPENGFISLNVPLTFTRQGSHSTRTTHPFFLHTFQEVLRGLDVAIELKNPYQFKTKGEMVAECKNQVVLRTNFEVTLSCAHPDQARFRGMSPGTHCGYCTPCIIRRSSLERNGLRDRRYVKDVKTEVIPPQSSSGRDPRAFRLALERFQAMNKRHTLLHIMNSGPLSHFSRKELIELTRMYQQGMEEVAQILN